MSKGWQSESARHSLAAKGIETGRKKSTTFSTTTILQPNKQSQKEEKELMGRAIVFFKQKQAEYAPLPEPKKEMELQNSTPEQQQLFNKVWQKFKTQFPDDARRIHSIQISPVFMSHGSALNPGHIVLGLNDFRDEDDILHTLQHEVFHLRTVESGLALEDITNPKLEFMAAFYSGKDFDKWLKQYKEEKKESEAKGW